MALTDVNLYRIDGSVGSIPSAEIDVIKNSASASNNIVLNSDGTTTLTPSDIIKSGVAQASTSGTAIDFTGIPSWVKRVTVMFDGVSTNGTSLPLIRLGDSGGIETTGYTGVSYTVVGASSATIAYSDGFTIAPTSNWLATAIVYGSYTLSLMNAATNTWVIQGTIGRPSGVYVYGAGGTKSLSDTLTQLRITTVNGTDTFDAGTINILYEG